MTDSIEPLEFRISSEYRRCCWYVLASGVAILPAFLWVAIVVQKRDWSNIIGCLFIDATMLLAMIAALRWRVRVDPKGLSRRVPLGWDFWPWSDFASGRVNKIGCTLCNPDRRLWVRYVHMAFMSKCDIEDVLQAINAHYQLPPPPNLPETIEIKSGLRRSATLDSRGIDYSEKGTIRSYSWDDVKQVLITRTDPLQRHFSKLVIILPDREIDTKVWQIHSREELNECLFRYVPENRIETETGRELLPKRPFIERDLAANQARVKDYSLMFRIFAPICIATFAWIAVDIGIVAAVVLSILGLAPQSRSPSISMARQKRRSAD